jgi:hypothetical protein
MWYTTTFFTPFLMLAIRNILTCSTGKRKSPPWHIAAGPSITGCGSLLRAIAETVTMRVYSHTRKRKVGPHEPSKEKTANNENQTERTSQQKGDGVDRIGNRRYRPRNGVIAHF